MTAPVSGFGDPAPRTLVRYFGRHGVELQSRRSSDRTALAGRVLDSASLSFLDATSAPKFRRGRDDTTTTTVTRFGRLFRPTDANSQYRPPVDSGAPDL